jgi:hypothetical protein
MTTPIPELAYPLDDALYHKLGCTCSCCDRYDDYPAPMDACDDTEAWSKFVAPLAAVDGWTSPGCLFLLCPTCRETGADWRKHYVPPPSEVRRLQLEGLWLRTDGVGPQSDWKSWFLDIASWIVLLAAITGAIIWLGK